MSIIQMHGYTPLQPETYEEYTFSAGSPVQTGWTVKSGSFAQGSLGSEWITRGSNGDCIMSRSLSGWNTYKVQSLFYAYNNSYSGGAYVGIGDSATSAKVGIYYFLSSANPSGKRAYEFIDGTDAPTYITTTNQAYISEIVYDGITYTCNIYSVDANEEPDTLLHTFSKTAANLADYLIMYSNSGTTPYPQFKWIKVRYK